MEGEDIIKNVFAFPGVVGDGQNDDTAGLQAALDSGASTVYLPVPMENYLISKPLVIHSRQTLLADRNAVIRLADHAHVYLLTNANHKTGDQGITVTGGIWDGNNLHQTCEYHENGRNWRVPYDPARYLGVVMHFNRVTDLRVAHLTLKDPETYGFQAGNLRQFSIEDITFDYNLQKGNMDGVHLHGHCHYGWIANLKGTTNDDLVALNADDAGMFEMCRGPITDIHVDGIWSENGYTGVRLLSAGSPIKRIKLANIYGTYRYNVVSFTNHRVHPGSASTFDDISIEGVFCSKASRSSQADPSDARRSNLSPIWIDAPAVVSHLGIRDYHRTESVLPTNDIHIEPGATVEHLVLDDVTLRNQCAAPINLLNNRGEIGSLNLQNVYAKAEGSGGRVVQNTGTISRLHSCNVSGIGFEVGVSGAIINA